MSEPGEFASAAAFAVCELLVDAGFSSWLFAGELATWSDPFGKVSDEAFAAEVAGWVDWLFGSVAFESLAGFAASVTGLAASSDSVLAAGETAWLATGADDASAVAGVLTVSVFGEELLTGSADFGESLDVAFEISGVA